MKVKVATWLEAQCGGKKGENMVRWFKSGV
jgi:hypothetical protein